MFITLHAEIQKSYRETKYLLTHQNHRRSYIIVYFDKKLAQSRVSESSGNFKDISNLSAGYHSFKTLVYL